jgi:amino acid transporter
VGYILPLAAMAFAGLSVHTFSTGDWTTAAESLGGPALGVAVVAGGAISGIGMFNALVMSYTRLPMAMAEEGMFPRFVALRNRQGVPWVSVLFCGVAWALALKLPFERLISIDLILYGSSLLLEFVALAALRLREPHLERPFKAGSFPVACLLGVGPAVLIAYALYVSRNEKLLDPGTVLGGHFGSWLGSIPALLFALCVGLLGPLLYWITAASSHRSRTEPLS